MLTLQSGCADEQRADKLAPIVLLPVGAENQVCHARVTFPSGRNRPCVAYMPLYRSPPFKTANFYRTSPTLGKSVARAFTARAVHTIIDFRCRVQYAGKGAPSNGGRSAGHSWHQLA